VNDTIAVASRSATDPAGPTGALATWLGELELAMIPERVRTRAVHLLLDGIGCSLIGAQLPWSRVAVEAVTALEGAGDATIIGWGRSAGGPAAAVLNGTFIQGFELDDFHPFAPLHSNSLVIPSLFAASEVLGGVSGGRFLLGAIAGFETGPRVGKALHGAEMLSRGWHSGSVFGTHASAAAASVALGLDAGTIEDALGLAGTQSAGLMAAQYEAMSKRMHHGLASRNGLYATALAMRGYTGIKRVFEREYGGYLSVFGEGHEPDATAITRGLGQKWETESIIVKSYAVMGGLHGAVDAVLALTERDGFGAADVERIHLAIGDAVYHHGWWQPERPLTAIGAQMNIGYAVAVTLLDREALPDQFRATRLDSDDVWELIGRTTVEHAVEFDVPDPTKRFATRLVITTADGAEHSITIDQPKGGPANPVTDDDVITKFRAITGRVMDATRSRAIENAVLAVGELDNLSELIDLLAEPVGRALD
jgi:2-methylcitrate dehydratase PrpD